MTIHDSTATSPNRCLIFLARTKRLLKTPCSLIRSQMVLPVDFSPYVTLHSAYVLLVSPLMEAANDTELKESF